MNLIEKAINVATKAHVGQVRKGTELPYITHPFAVGMILAQAKCSEEVIAAGILHDTVEDTNITLADIEELFGRRVARIVEGCSESYKDLPWEERKRHTLEELKHAPQDIKLVACADKLHNVRSMADDLLLLGEDLWNRFKRGRDKHEWYYRSVVESLGYEKPFPLLEELKDAVVSVFGVKREEELPPKSEMDAFFERLFLYAYPERAADVDDAELARLLNVVHSEAERIRFHDETQFGEAWNYLSGRGIEFEHFEGTQIVISFYEAVRQRFGMYHYELYPHFLRNVKKGVL